MAQRALVMLQERGEGEESGEPGCDFRRPRAPSKPISPMSPDTASDENTEPLGSQLHSYS